MDVAACLAISAQAHFFKSGDGGFGSADSLLGPVPSEAASVRSVAQALDAGSRQSLTRCCNNSSDGGGKHRRREFLVSACEDDCLRRRLIIYQCEAIPYPLWVWCRTLSSAAKSLTLLAAGGPEAASFVSGWRSLKNTGHLIRTQCSIYTLHT